MVEVVVEAAVVVEAVVEAVEVAVAEEQVLFPSEVPQGRHRALRPVVELVLRFRKVKFSAVEHREVGPGLVYMEAGHINQLTLTSKFLMFNQCIWKWVF